MQKNSKNVRGTHSQAALPILRKSCGVRRGVATVNPPTHAKAVHLPGHPHSLSQTNEGPGIAYQPKELIFSPLCNDQPLV